MKNNPKDNLRKPEGWQKIDEAYNWKGNLAADVVMAGAIGLEGVAVYFGVLPNLGNAVFVPAGYRALQALYNGLIDGKPNTALAQMGEAALLAGAGAAYRMS